MEQASPKPTDLRTAVIIDWDSPRRHDIFNGAIAEAAAEFPEDVVEVYHDHVAKHADGALYDHWRTGCEGEPWPLVVGWYSRYMAPKARCYKPEAPKEDPLADPTIYPVDALGTVLERAVWAIEQTSQCSVETAACAVLGVASLAAQGVADVLMPFGQTRPSSLFLLTVVESGGRKTTADNEAKKPVKARERELGREYAERVLAYKAKRAQWRSDYNAIDKDKTVKGVAKEKAFADLGPEPIPPRSPKLTLPDSTQEGFVKNSRTMQPALGIFSPDGAQFIEGCGFAPDKKTASGSVFSVAWDGGDLSRGRGGDGILDPGDIRLAVHVAVQPNVARRFMSDEDLRDQGFLARFLPASPRSLKGQRPYKRRPAECLKIMAKYEAWMLALFNAAKTKNGEGRELDLRVLPMSAGAEAAWIDYHNEVNDGEKPRGRYVDIHEVATKSPEQAARIAGCLALFDHPKANEIDGDTMKRAVKLARWYLDEALRILEGASTSDAADDADKLYTWAIKKPMNRSDGWLVSLHDIQRGPRRFRTPGPEGERIIAAAIKSLVSTGRGVEPSKGQLVIRYPN